MPPHDQIVDPVCGMSLRPSQSPATREHGGTTYWFCSLTCAARFDLDSDAYAAVARLDLPGWGFTPHPPAIVEQFRQEVDGP